MKPVRHARNLAARADERNLTTAQVVGGWMPKGPPIMPKIVLFLVLILLLLVARWG